MKTVTPPWPTDDPRARTEWDFRARWKGCAEGQFEFLPPEEVWYCHCYEYDRMLSRTVEDVTEWRKGNGGTDFESLLGHYRKAKATRNEVVIGNHFHMFWPEWPTKPYLCIPWAERRKRFELMWPARTRSPRLQPLPLREVCQAIRDPRKCGDSVRHVFLPWEKSRPPENDGRVYTVWSRDREDGREYPVVIVAFALDFKLSPTLLAAKVEQWCRHHQKLRQWKAKPNRGQTSDTDKLRSQLNYLGAWRLNQSGLSYQQAIRFTTNHSDKPLFADKADWSRAVKQAAGILEL